MTILQVYVFNFIARKRKKSKKKHVTVDGYINLSMETSHVMNENQI